MKWCFLFLNLFFSILLFGQNDFQIKSADKEAKKISRELSANQIQKIQIENIYLTRFEQQNQIFADFNLSSSEKFLKNSAIYYASYAEINKILDNTQKQKLSNIIVPQDVILQQFLNPKEGQLLSKEEMFYVKMSWKYVLTPNNTQ